MEKGEASLESDEGMRTIGGRRGCLYTTGRPAVAEFER